MEQEGQWQEKAKNMWISSQEEQKLQKEKRERSTENYERNNIKKVIQK